MKTNAGIMPILFLPTHLPNGRQITANVYQDILRQHMRHVTLDATNTVKLVQGREVLNVPPAKMGTTIQEQAAYQVILGDRIR